MATNGTFEERYRRITLTGAPVEDGANVTGSFLGPSVLRAIGLPGMLTRLGCDVVDYGDLTPAARAEPLPMCNGKRVHNASNVARWLRVLSDTAYELARERDLPVFLGGDHSLSMGTVEGIAQYCTEIGRELFVLWLDAHPDFNTPSISPSGNMHGMSLAYLCGEPGFDTVLGVTPRNPINPSNVFLFGTRAIDVGEGELVHRRGVNMIGMDEIKQLGVALSIRRVLEIVAKRGGVLHLSLDADVLDPSFAPGVNVPVSGGVTYGQAHLIMQMLNQSGLVTSLDVVELNPLLDVASKSARLTAELVACLFDRKAAGRHDHSSLEVCYGHHATQIN